MDGDNKFHPEFPRRRFGQDQGNSIPVHDRLNFNRARENSSNEKGVEVWKEAGQASSPRIPTSASGVARKAITKLPAQTLLTASAAKRMGIWGQIVPVISAVRCTCLDSEFRGKDSIL